MKKLFVLMMLWILVMAMPVLAIEATPDTNIPEMSFEDLIQAMRSRGAKVDIIKKNNVEITTLKENLKQKIVEAATKVNELKIEVYQDNLSITDETLEELRVLLTFLQTAKRTLEEDVDKISSEIDSILDLISTKSMQLDQYDLLIEKQNEVIVEMKNILGEVSKI